MSKLLDALRTRLFTAFGTVIYFDDASLKLRHGPVESSPPNALFVADPSSPRRGWLLLHVRETWTAALCDLAGCRPVSEVNGTECGAPTMLELVPLERGLVAFRSDTVFLS